MQELPDFITPGAIIARDLPGGSVSLDRVLHVYTEDEVSTPSGRKYLGLD